MTEMTKYTPGQFCWVDFSAPDYDAAKKFFGAFFGWTVDEPPPHEGQPSRYGMFKLGDKVVAGLGEYPAGSPEQMPAVWNSYVCVEDCAATAAKAKELGGEVMFPAQEVPGAGTLAYLKDPQGAVVALWQPNNHGGSEIVNEPNSFSWNELATRDIDGASAFYAGLFGWELDKQEMGPSTIVLVKNAGRENGHFLKMTEEWGDMPPSWAVYFAVDDCDAMAKKAEDLGAKVAVPPTDIPPGRFSVIAEPQGGHFYIIKLAEQPS